MTVKTYSAWSYGHSITTENNQLPFSENGIDELVGELNSGGYTISSLATEMARSMNSVGTLNYTASVDRTTGIITISGDSNFFLYVTSSTLSGISAYQELGFTTERSGANTYDGDERSGSIFEPQFLLQSYVDFVDNQKSNNVTVQESATGKVQVVKYGNVNFMECNITLQTNIPQGKGSIIKNDVAGYDNLLAFMQYATTKQPLEFYKDIDDPENTFTDCIVEKTASDSKGTGFKLKELYSRGFADWWETGIISFRELK
jgi:hypothetical protein